VTGGTGLIGRWTVTRLSQQGHKIKVLARNALQRENEFFDWIRAHEGNPDHISLLDGDLCKSNMGLSNNDQLQLLNTDIIYHMGAAFGWGLDAKQTRQVTVNGSRELIKLASELPNLKQVVHLSGYMLAAPHVWELLNLDAHKQDATQQLNEQQVDLLYKTFAAYEAAKIEAHFVLKHLAFKKNIPLTNILLSSAIGDSQTGEIDQPHGIPMLVKGIWNNEMLVIPGAKQDWLPLVTVDYLVDFILGVITLPETIGQDYVVLDDETPDFGEMISLIAKRMGNRAPTLFMPKRIIQSFYNMGFDKLVDSSAESLDFLQPYRFNTEPMKQVAAKLGITKPDIHQAINNMVDYLIGSEFGEKSSLGTAESGKYYRVENTQTFAKGQRENPNNVLLHGMPFNSDSWDKIVTRLNGSSLAADIPNVSRSKGEYKSRLSWMRALLSEQTDATNLVAHSIGTGFAIDYASNHPDKVKSVVLISPYFLQSKPDFVTKIPFAGSMLKSILNKKMFNKLVLDNIPARIHLDGAYSNTRRSGVFRSIFKELNRAGGTEHRKELQSLLLNIQVPTLIIHGTNDPLIESLPVNENIHTAVIEYAGHSPHLSHEEEVSLLIKRFTNNPLDVSAGFADSGNKSGSGDGIISQHIVGLSVS